MSVTSEITRIKQNIADSYTQAQNKGATIPTEKNSENLPNAIASITGGGEPKVIIPKTITQNGVYNAIDDNADGYSPVSVDVSQDEPFDFNTIEIPEVLKTGTNYYFKTRAGNWYISNSNANTGIWFWDTQIDTITQVHTSGQSFQYWFEAKNGDVYVSGSSSGVFRIRGGITTGMFSGTNYQYFFEDSKGNIYISSYNSSSVSDGVWCIGVDEVVKNLFNKGSRWAYFVETPNGIYVSSGSPNALGIYKLTPTTANQILSTGYAHFATCQIDSEGTIYTGGINASGGVYAVTSSSVSLIFPFTSGMMNIFQKDLSGNIYATAANNTGLYRLTSDNATLISDKFGLSNWFEASDGTIYVNGNSSSTAGLFILTPSSLIPITGGETIYNHNSWFEASDGTIYLGSNQSTQVVQGLYVITGAETKIATRITTFGYVWNFYEDTNNNVYASASSTGQGNIGFSKLIQTSINQLFGYLDNYKFEQKGDNLLATNASGLRVTYNLLSNTITNIAQTVVIPEPLTAPNNNGIEFTVW